MMSDFKNAVDIPIRLNGTSTANDVADQLRPFREFVRRKMSCRVEEVTMRHETAKNEDNGTTSDRPTPLLLGIKHAGEHRWDRSRGWQTQQWEGQDDARGWADREIIANENVSFRFEDAKDAVMFKQATGGA